MGSLKFYKSWGCVRTNTKRFLRTLIPIHQPLQYPQGEFVISVKICVYTKEFFFLKSETTCNGTYNGIVKDDSINQRTLLKNGFCLRGITERPLAFNQYTYTRG